MMGQTELDLDTLRELVPLNTLSDDRLMELAAIATVETVAAGETIFRAGDQDDQSVYLLNGEIALQGPDEPVAQTLWHGMPEARHPLEDRQPRRATAMAVTDARVARLDNSVVDYMVAWDQLSALHDGSEEGFAAPGPGEEGSAKEEADVRTTRALPFRSIPSSNLKALLERMERLPVKAGETVVEQGDQGDYYYLIDEGEAVVTRQVTVAELNQGAAFGEEALLSDAERNASVTMKTDGAVLRLSKDDFNLLLRQPMLHWIDADEARALVNAGAQWLDVRHAREFNHAHLPNAVNLPLDELRLGLAELEPQRHYVCYCQTGQRSSAAAFVLKQNGFQVSVLRGGLRAVPPFLRNPAVQGAQTG